MNAKLITETDHFFPSAPLHHALPQLPPLFSASARALIPRNLLLCTHHVQSTNARMLM